MVEQLELPVQAIWEASTSSLQWSFKSPFDDCKSGYSICNHFGCRLILTRLYTDGINFDELGDDYRPQSN